MRSTIWCRISHPAFAPLRLGRAPRIAGQPANQLFDRNVHRSINRLPSLTVMFLVLF